MIGLRLDSEARLQEGADCLKCVAGAQREVLAARCLCWRTGRSARLRLAALLKPKERILQHPARSRAGDARVVHFVETLHGLVAVVLLDSRLCRTWG